MPFAAVGSIVSGAISLNTTLYPSYPSGVVSSAPLFLYVGHSNTILAMPYSFTVPATWTLIAQSSYAQSKCAVYFSPANATHSSTETVSVSISTLSTGGVWKSFIVRFTDLKPSSTALLYTETTGSAGDGTTMFAPSPQLTLPANLISFAHAATQETMTEYTGETASGGCSTWSQQFQSTVNIPSVSLQTALLTTSSGGLSGGSFVATSSTPWLTIGIGWELDAQYGQTIQNFGALTLSAKGGIAVSASLGLSFGGLAVSARLGSDETGSALTGLPGLGVVASGGCEQGARLVPQSFGGLLISAAGTASTSTASSSTSVSMPNYNRVFRGMGRRIRGITSF